nr:unnamed protein product [Digitaria exilis]
MPAARLRHRCTARVALDGGGASRPVLTRSTAEDARVLLLARQMAHSDRSPSWPASSASNGTVGCFRSATASSMPCAAVSSAAGPCADGVGLGVAQP